MARLAKSLPGILLVLCLAVYANTSAGYASNSDAIGVQLPEKIDPPKSLGLPPNHRFQIGLVGGYNWDVYDPVERLFLNDHTLVSLPQMGGLRFTLEAGIQFEGDRLGGTGTIYGTLFGIQNGFEYDTRKEKFLYRAAVNLVIRRGGLFGFGDRIRMEWVPATRTALLGLTANAPWSGYRRNRPDKTYVPLLRGNMPPAPATRSDHFPENKVADIRQSMVWMDRLMTPRLVYDIDSHRKKKKFYSAVESLRERIDTTGRSFVEEDSRYHRLLDEVFTETSSGREETGKMVAGLAERVYLRNLIIPVNRLFGQHKKPFDLSDFAANAVTAFSDSLSVVKELNDAERASSMLVFRRVLAAMQTIAQNSRKRWDDDRLVWLPLQYGLRPDGYDSNAEVDSVIGLLTQRPVYDANYIQYLENNRCYQEMERLVRDTRHYHVLHIHDVAGYHAGEPDRISWRLVTEGYINAFIRAIEEVDRGDREHLPQFMIYIDQFYYEKNRGRPVVSFLERLMTAGGYDIKDDSLRAAVLAAQARLTEAVENSRKFSRYSEREVAELIRVHVNVTNTFNPTFTEDAVFRDHRKIAFRDIFEDAPAMGEAVFAGTGVGEHYTNPWWEDRAILVRGPGLVHLKESTRRLFLSQGFGSDDVPYYLRPRGLPENMVEVCENLRRRGWTASVVTVFNETGFGRKEASIIRATLYSLLGPGWLVVAPDSLWASDYWGSVLFAAALRGAEVYAIAPGRKQAPSTAPMTLELVRKTLRGMLQLRDEFESVLAANGGVVRVGFYDRESDVNDLHKRWHAFRKRLSDDTDLRRRFDIHPELVESASMMCEKLADTAAYHVNRLVTDSNAGIPKLHLKAQFVLSSRARKMLAEPGWGAILHDYVAARCMEVTEPLERDKNVDLGLVQKNLINSLEVNPLDAGGKESQSPVIALTVGSHNQDRRGMLLDGEALVLVTGYEAMIAAVDFALFVGTTKWLDTPDQVNEEYPRQGGLIRTIARWIKDWI